MRALDAVIFGLYMAGVLAIGWYHYRRNRDAEDYFVGGRAVGAAGITQHQDEDQRDHEQARPDPGSDVHRLLDGLGGVQARGVRTGAEAVPVGLIIDEIEKIREEYTLFSSDQFVQRSFIVFLGAGSRCWTWRPDPVAATRFADKSSPLGPSSS